jgi:hypothetical protein
MITISLIGEQPIPNLLPMRYQPPAAVVLVYTERTQAAAGRIERLLPGGCEAAPCLVSPYDIQEIARALQALIEKHKWAAADLLFNLTGGTKAMALAAYLVAATYSAPFIYLQSEGKRTRLYRYEFDANRVPHVVSRDLLHGLIKIDDYLRAYVDDYQLMGFAKDETGALFEQAIYEALEPVVDEIVAGARLLGALEVDMVVRCENQVGIIEAKTGPGARRKGGIDQLNTAGGQRYLGTYTRKMLVIDQRWDKSRSNLRELAEARRIAVIELPSFCTSGQLSPEDVKLLRCTACNQLGREVQL